MAEVGTMSLSTIVPREEMLSTGTCLGTPRK
jgi:hypothetical protein